MNNGVTNQIGTVCCNGVSLTVMPEAMMVMISLKEMRLETYILPSYFLLHLSSLMIRAVRHSLNDPVYMNIWVPVSERRKSKSLQGISDFMRTTNCSSQSCIQISTEGKTIGTFIKHCKSEFHSSLSDCKHFVFTQGDVNF
jgi:uncharacterized membrane protein YpjA